MIERYSCLCNDLFELRYLQIHSYWFFIRLNISPNEQVVVVILFLISSFGFCLVIIAIVTIIYLNITSKHSLDTSTYFF